MDRVIVPHHSPNDPRAIIVAWLVEDGTEVAANQIVASLESTKAIFEIETESSGFLRHLVSVGSEVTSGDVICAVTATRDEELPDDVLTTDSSEPDNSDLDSNLDGERTVTARAKILAERLGINLEEIPGTNRISADDIENYVAGRDTEIRAERQRARVSGFTPDYASTSGNETVQRLLIIGAGNGTKMVLDVLTRDHSSGLSPIGILDDSEAKHGTSMMGVQVLGSIDSALERWKSGDYDSAIITISSNNELRSQVYEHLTQHGVPFANIIDPVATLSPSSTMGTGNIIIGYCRIGPFAELGNDNFISTMANIEHDTLIGSHTSFGPSVAFSGRVQVGDGVKFGTSIGCEPGVRIGEWSVIASGSIVTQNVPARSILKAPSVGRIRPSNS